MNNGELHDKSIVVLSFGGGQDSTALLHLYRKDPAFREKYVGSATFLVVISATGDEFKETDQHVGEISTLCQKEGIPFFHLTADKGWHNDKAQDLISWYKRTDSCGSKAYPKSCTDKLKIVPIYNFLEAWVCKVWARDHGDILLAGAYGRKNGLKAYAAKYGKIRVILGIAAGEERRAAAGPDKLAKQPVWQRESLEKIYPLIDLGLDRAGCQKLIAAYGEKVPFPSNCRRCPFLNDIELLFLERHDPEALAEWIEIEAAKIRRDETRNTPVDKRYGVFVKTLLPEKLLEVRAKFGHMTDAELFEYRNSHGHCVMSAY
jgi:hypothetical protein